MDFTTELVVAFVLKSEDQARQPLRVIPEQVLHYAEPDMEKAVVLGCDEVRDDEFLEDTVLNQMVDGSFEFHFLGELTEEPADSLQQLVKLLSGSPCILQIISEKLDQAHDLVCEDIMAAMRVLGLVCHPNERKLHELDQALTFPCPAVERDAAQLPDCLVDEVEHSSREPEADLVFRLRVLEEIEAVLEHIDFDRGPQSLLIYLRAAPTLHKVEDHRDVVESTLFFH